MDTTSKQTGVKVKLVGTDGNIYAILGTVKKALTKAGHAAAANELSQRVFNDAKTYDAALAIVCEYVEAY